MSSAPKKSPPAELAGGQPAAHGSPPERSSPGESPPAIARVPLNRYLTFAAIVIVGTAADLLTKHAVFRWLGVASDFLQPGNAAAAERWRGDRQLTHLWWLWPGRLGVQTSINTGALFGMGAGWWWLFAMLAVAAVVAIVIWLFYYGDARDRWLTVALATVTAGILGNLYDRLGLWDGAGLRSEFHHGVRDWILFVWPEVKLRIFNPWPNFNIADSLLVTGAIMLVIHSLVWHADPGPKPPTTPVA